MPASPQRCAWTGCGASYAGERSPPGWCKLFVLRAEVNPFLPLAAVLLGPECLGELVVCPRHIHHYAPAVGLAGLPGGLPLGGT
jgi:hypothetical protein